MSAVKYQTMPPLSTEEYAQLEQSILADGVQVPIIVDDAGVVIDGHHRKRIAEHHGLHCPREVRSMLTEAQKTALSISLNIARRQLNREQKRAIIEASVKAQPEKSNREHARELGVSHVTVGAARDELESTGQIDQLAKTVGADGRERPATRPTQVAAFDADGILIDADTGEVVEDSPSTTEHTVTEKVKTVTGLDGKEYRQRPREVKRVLDGDDAIQQNAEQGCLAVGRALDALESLGTERRRKLILNDWWPRAHENVTPLYTRLFNSTDLRRIADGLNELAHDMEAHNDYQ